MINKSLLAALIATISIIFSIFLGEFAAKSWLAKDSSAYTDQAAK